uniref:Uncharacterized protein n=1 Tax=Alexandrium monilatum TaxID=311494 RepID=A0A7S4VE71_9DINO
MMYSGFLNATAGSRRGAGKRALLALLAVAALTESPTFLETLAARPASSAASPRGAPLRPSASLGPWAGPAGPAESAAPGRPGFVAGMLAFIAAGLIAFSSPDRASAGLLSDFGRVDYDTEIQQSKASYRTKQQSKVLDVAAEKAKEKAKKKEAELADKQKAAELFKKLDEKQKAKEAREAAKEKRVEEQRAKILAELEKKKAKAGSGDEASAKAEGMFQKFLANKAAKEAEKEAEAKKQDEMRAQVLRDLEKRKTDAKKAAEEAEAIALRIEELAKNAREAALLAKQSADALQ